MFGLLGLLTACTAKSEKANEKPAQPATPLVNQIQAPSATDAATFETEVDSAFLSETRAKEAGALRRYHSLVRRDGKQLHLNLANGKEVILTDGILTQVGAVVYDFVAYYPRPGYYLIHYTFSESDGQGLIDQRTGKRKETASAPIFSPDSTRMVFALFDLDTAGLGDGSLLEIYRLTPTGLQREFSKDLRDHGPVNVRWLDSVTVQFNTKAYVTKLDSSSEIQTMGTYLLRKVPGGKWEMVPKE